MEKKFRLLSGNVGKPLEVDFSWRAHSDVWYKVSLNYLGNGVVSIEILRSSTTDSVADELAETLSQLIEINPEMELKGLSGPIPKNSCYEFVAVFA